MLLWNLWVSVQGAALVAISASGGHRARVCHAGLMPRSHVQVRDALELCSVLSHSHPVRAGEREATGADNRVLLPANVEGVDLIMPNYQKKKEQFIADFKQAFDLDAEEKEIALAVRAVHERISTDHDLYIAVSDALSSRERSAIKAYLRIAKEAK